MPKTLKEIASFLNGELVGDGSVLIKGVKGIEDASDGDLSFILSRKFEKYIAHSRASALIVPKDVTDTSGKPSIRVDNPSIAFSKAIGYLLPERIAHPKGIDRTALISKKASVGAAAAIGPYVVIEDDASVGDGTVIYPFCYVGKSSRVGRDCVIYPNVTVREEVLIGDRVTIHPGSVIGADGFGYDTRQDGTHTKIPQLGTVVIEDDVELGACVTVDRARFAKTVIGKGSKIDNLVQVAHNVTMGPNCLIAAQTGISGSCRIGRNVVMGGQVGIADHITIGDFSMLGAKTGVTKSFPKPGTTLFWYPARPVDKVRDIIASIGLLPKLFARVKALEVKIKELESDKAKDG
jgi:UDP-3-O-[3-hydroxymyristoyl] glucosamine N-acyltransferase